MQFVPGKIAQTKINQPAAEVTSPETSELAAELAATKAKLAALEAKVANNEATTDPFAVEEAEAPVETSVADAKPATGETMLVEGEFYPAEIQSETIVKTTYGDPVMMVEGEITDGQYVEQQIVGEEVIIDNGVTEGEIITEGEVIYEQEVAVPEYDSVTFIP